MNALARNAGGRAFRRWCHGLAALWLACGGSAFAQDVVTVPAAHLQHTEGSVAYAPPGDQEWHDVQPRRLLKRGDRLWTDRGSRAELQAGGHAVRLNGQTQLVLENVGETATQLNLTQGSVAATVTRMNPGDSFEIGTPNLAFRARQAGDYRIDVDAGQGFTRVVVLSGSAVVFGEKGEALEMRNGQRAAFRERDLTRVPQSAFVATDDFDHWVGARRRGEPTVTMPALPVHPPAAPAPAKAQAIPDLTVAPAAAPAAPLRVAAAAAARAKAQAPSQQEPGRPAAKRADEDRKRAQAQRAQEEKDKRAAAARRAEDERRQAQARRAAEEKRLAAARKAEAQKLADDRRRQLARLQEQARREEQAAQARRAQQTRRAEEERREEAARREQERRDEEVWLRQQQVQPPPYPQPVRPAPMGVPGRRIS